jgi:hypothetical protein
MKVFISWSKPTSRQLAETLYRWLPEVIQQVQPWMSSEDIAKGQRWATEIGAKLGELGQGILCLTSDNLKEPWLNFEAGALAKALDDARVRPVLLDLQPSQITGPLAQFQATVVTDREDMSRLIASLNETCPASLDAARLKRAFDRNWDDLSARVDAILQAPERPKTAPGRTPDDMIAELLDRVRLIHGRIGRRQNPLADLDVEWPRDSDGNEVKPGEDVSWGEGHGRIMDVALMTNGGVLVLVRDSETGETKTFPLEAVTLLPF